MKQFAKLLCLLMAFLMAISVLVACGETVGNETESKEKESAVNEPTFTPEEYVEDDIPDDLRFDGQTLTFFTRDDNEPWLYEMDSDVVLNDTLYDSVYYRNKTVEEQLGVTITTIHQKGSNNSVNSWLDAYRVAVNGKTGDFEAAAINMSSGSALAVEGLFYNVMDFPYISLEKPWWNQSIQDELVLFDALYFLAGDICVSEISWGLAFFYNKDILDRFFPDGSVDLYQTVVDKKWTIDYMYNVVAQVYEDTDGSGSMSDGDLVGLLEMNADNRDNGQRDAWITSLGIDVTTKIGGLPEFTFYSSRTVEAFEKLRALHLQNPGTLALTGTTLTTFENGNALFYMNRLNHGSIFRQTDVRYGIVPVPMLEENQECGYRTYVFGGASAIVIVSSLPEEKKEFVGATLELMAAESYRQVTPAYCEVALKTKYSEDVQDSAMFDLIIDSTHFSFAFLNSSSLGGVCKMFRNLTIDFSQSWEENKGVYQEKLDDLIDGLDEISFINNYGG